MFGATSSVMGQPTAQSTGLTGLQAVPPTITSQQLQYLELVKAHRESLYQLLNDTSPHLINFTYECDPNQCAHRNAQLRQSIQYVYSNMTDSAAVSQLIDRYKRAVDRCPNPNECAIVPIKSRADLVQRIKSASTALDTLQQTLDHASTVTDSLKIANADFKQRLDDVQERHNSIRQKSLALLNLMEELAMQRGCVESNPRGLEINAEILYRLEKEFQWSDWQQRIDLLTMYIDSVRKSALDASVPRSYLDSRQMNALHEILSSRSDAVEAISKGLKISAKHIAKIDDAIVANAATRYSK